MDACMHKDARVGSLRACSPMKFLEIRYSASEAILGQKQSRIVATWPAEYSIQFLDAIHFVNLLSQLTVREGLWLAEQQIGPG